MALYHSSFSVDIYNQSGQPIALCVYQPEAIGVNSISDAYFFPVIVSIRYLQVPEFLINGLVIKGNDSHANTGILVMAGSNPFTALVKYFHYIAIFGLTIHSVDRTRENPGMKSSDRLIAVCF